MKLRLIIILIAFSISGFSQIDNIKTTASRLNGYWLLETYEYDSLKKIQVEEKGKVVFKTYVDNKLIKTDIKDGWNVFELSFKADGQGDFQEYIDYQLDSEREALTILSCQPVPELQIQDGKVVIHMTYMFGQGIEKIEELTDKKLVLLGDDKIRQTFKRIR